MLTLCLGEAGPAGAMGRQGLNGANGVSLSSYFSTGLDSILLSKRSLSIFSLNRQFTFPLLLAIILVLFEN
jgi:hypothetical protein